MRSRHHNPGKLHVHTARSLLRSDSIDVMNRFCPSRLVMLVLSVAVCSFVPILAQRRQPPTRTQRSRPPAIDYSKFSHATQKHQAACNTCHKVPTPTWQKTESHPDITDYPGHAACVSCHRPQFFKGPRPPICTVCHTKVSPRDDARLVFRNPASRLQFTIEFPHDKHQDVIATLLKAPQFGTGHVFMRASFRDQSIDKPGQIYNNCSICHVQQTVAPSPPAGTWTDGFIPETASFKSAPNSHSSCFNCHWKSQQPIADNCAGCHKLATTPSVVVNTPVRISLKFNHEGGGEKKNHLAECTTCHINITKAESLRGLKPDVPITSCTECHNKEGLRQDVSKELSAIDKNSAFVCVYCHTSNVGKLDPPSSHYLIAERPPLKRKDVK
jgi:Class III cytochrome C family